MAAIRRRREEQSKRRATDEAAEVVHLAHEHYGAAVSYRNLTYGAIQGMLRTLDPHSNFLDAKHYRTMREEQRGSQRECSP